MSSPLHPYVVTLPPIAQGSTYPNQYTPGAAIVTYPQGLTYPAPRQWPIYPSQQGSMMVPSAMSGYYPYPYAIPGQQRHPAYLTRTPFSGPSPMGPLLAMPPSPVVQPWSASALPMTMARQGYVQPTYSAGAQYALPNAQLYGSPGPATVIVDSESSSHHGHHHHGHGYGQSQYGHYDDGNHHHQRHEHRDSQHHHHDHGYGLFAR